jgi:hypothetical protein
MRFTQEWRRFKESPAGRRFLDRFRRKHTVGGDRRWRRPLYIGGGAIVFFVGVLIKAIPFVPGGAVVMALGLSMVSRESRTAAQWLDRVELRLRNLSNKFRKRFGRS